MGRRGVCNKQMWHHEWQCKPLWHKADPNTCLKTDLFQIHLPTEYIFFEHIFELSISKFLQRKTFGLSKSSAPKPGWENATDTTIAYSHYAVSTVHWLLRVMFLGCVSRGSNTFARKSRAAPWYFRNLRFQNLIFQFPTHDSALF